MRDDIKQEQVAKGLGTSALKSAQKWNEPSQWWKDKTTKATIYFKDSLRKKPCKTKTNKSRDTEIETERERQPELAHLFKSNFLYGVFLYTSHACFFFMWGVVLTHPVLASFILIEGFSFTYTVLASFLCGVFLLHIPCWLYFHLGSFSYTSHGFFIYCWEFLLHVPCWLSFFFFLIEGGSLTHPVLDSFLSMEFLLNIPCRFRFYVGSFSYTSHADFVFMQGVSSTHPVLASF